MLFYNFDGEMGGIVQKKIKRALPSDIEKGIRYYSILSVISELKLRRKEIELLAFTSVKGNITHPSLREEFVRMFDSSSQSLENIKSRLRKQKWLIDIDGKCKVNPKVNLDLSGDIILQINLTKIGEGSETDNQGSTDQDLSKRSGDTRRRNGENRKVPIRRLLPSVEGA